MSLVRLAVETDDPGRLIAAAEPELGLQLGLVGSTGNPLGHAPDTAAGRQALAIAAAAARSQLASPPGWTIIPIARGASRLGFLAVGGGAANDVPPGRLLDLLAALLADQLQRLALLQTHVAAFVQRLVSDPEFGTKAARREAAELGLALADSYWSAILAWRSTPPAAVVEAVGREARALAGDSLTASLEGRVVLLHAGADRLRVADWLGRIVACARRTAPSLRAQAIADDGPVELGLLSVRAAELYALWQLGPRAETEQPVLSVRHYALDRLLRDAMEPGEARAFVDEQLGQLIASDREDRTDLLTVLEAGLDFPRHDRAAKQCFMHRNTFRHRHKRATEILGHSLEEPNARLAVHVALKLRRVLAQYGGTEGGESRRQRVAPGRGRRGTRGSQRRLASRG